VATDHSLQEFPFAAAEFDVVVMYDVINHLHDAVVAMHRDSSAFERYVAILQNLLRLRLANTSAAAGGEAA
jgi:hypothetical protein